MNLLVLGSGFLGAALARRCPGSVHSSRDPGMRPADRRWVRFDARDASSWASLEGLVVDGVVVALPLDPEMELAALWERLQSVASGVVVVGTTSAFGEAREVTDTTPVDPTNPRAAAEEQLRVLGATVLHAAGIYGPGRNPLDWVRRGRVDNAGKLVNLIHVDDLARACLFLLDGFAPGLRIVCSDGTPWRWRAIIEAAVARGWITDPRLPDEDDPRSKRVSPGWLAAHGFRWEHADLVAELERLERRG